MNYRLAHRILIVVALFIVAVVGMLVVRSRSMRPEIVATAPSSADLAMKEVELQEESAGGRWHLVADEASVFEKEGRTALKNITVRVQDRERAWTIVGQEGDLYKETRDFEIRDRVVVTSDDGLRLETSVLRWENTARRLWTDAPVRIVRDGNVVLGSGLEVKMAEALTTVQGRVRATFARGSWQ
jgi:LPS export ABC transporter protein LptC